jgi:hypothetical protein
MLRRLLLVGVATGLLAGISVSAAVTVGPGGGSEKKKCPGPWCCEVVWTDCAKWGAQHCDKSGFCPKDCDKPRINKYWRVMTEVERLNLQYWTDVRGVKTNNNCDYAERR